MHIVLAALLAFGILTLWIPAAWPVSVFELGVFALTLWAVYRIRRQPPIVAYPLVPLTLAILIGLFQLLTHRTVYAFDTTQSTVQWLTFLCVFLVVTAAVRDEVALFQMQEAMLWFGSTIALLATLQIFTGGGKIYWLFSVAYSETAMGPILYYNHYAAFIELLLPLSLYRALCSSVRRYLYAAMTAVLYASVIASTSRAGTVLATVGILSVAALAWRCRLVPARHASLVLGRIAAMLVLFTLIVGWGTVWHRLQQPDPMNLRREMDTASIHMIGEHPWTGVGQGAWPTAYPSYAVIDAGADANQAHCDWLQWAAEGGIPFGISMVILFAWSLRQGIRTIWGLGIVSVFLHAIVDYPFSRPALGSWFILMLALLAVSQFRTSRQQS